MDIVFIGAIVLFLALTWGMASGCARLAVFGLGRAPRAVTSENG